MKQPKSKIIGKRADDIFNYLRPKNWVMRSQQEIDFGVDFEIEILDEKMQTTGSLAKVQLKGSENITYINNGNTITFSFELDNAKYLIEEISVPTYLVVCDNNIEKCYWISLKNNKELENSFYQAIKNKQKTFSIHIDVANDFSKTSNEMINDMSLSNKIIASKIINKIHFYDYANLNIDIDTFEKNMLNQIENIGMHKMQELLDANDLEALLKLIKNNLESDKSITFKFNTLAYKGAILKKSLVNINEHSTQKAEYRSNINFNIGMEYVELTKDLPDDNVLKISSQLWLDIAVLYKLSSNYQWLNISIQQHEKEPDDLTGFWMLTISHQLKELLKAIAESIGNILKGINSVVLSNQCGLLIDIIPEFILSLTGFLFFSIRENEKDFKILEKNLDLLVNLALNLSKNMGNNINWDKFVLLIQVKMQYKSIYISTNNKSYGKKLKNDIYPYVFQIPDKNLRMASFLFIKQYTKNILEARNSTTQDIPIDDEIAILKEQMRGLGVNTDNPQSEYDGAIVEAIEALNPERVLKNCVYLYVYQSMTSPIGQMLKLYTLGIKGLCCTKYNYRIENIFLDNVSSAMEYFHCLNCKKRKRHENNWKWTREWQLEQNEKHHNTLFSNKR